MNEERYAQHQQGIFRNVRYLNVTKRFPFPAESFECVYSSHMLEHIPKDRVPGTLAEIRRVLCRGGVVRTSVPDLDYFVAHYEPTDPDTFVDGVFEIGRNGNKNRHHWMYNRHSLPRLLAAHGFVNAEVCAFREGKCADLDRLDNRPDHSLFVEAIKP
jgi:predicted SAM-dependent methyltransferase